MLQRLIDKVLDRHDWFLLGERHGRCRNHFGIDQRRVLQGAADGVLHEQLLQVKIRLRLDQALLICSDGVLSSYNLNWSKAPNLNLLLRVGKGLLRECE